MMTYSALLDANVLYPAFLRDVLMWLSHESVYNARFTDDIHDEWTRNVLLNNTGVTPAQVARTRRLMNSFDADALVTGYSHLIPTLHLPDPDDRHVLAAAIYAGVSTIVTFNLRDFPDVVLSDYAITAMPPDDFLCLLFAQKRDAVLDRLRRHRESLSRPARTPDEYLLALQKSRLPQFAARVEPFRLSL